MLLYRQDKTRQSSMANTKTTKLDLTLEKASRAQNAQRNQYSKSSASAVSRHSFRPTRQTT